MMLVNRIISVDEDFGSGLVVEPVTLEEVKDYLRLQGFTSDESGEQEFDFDDNLIQAMITEGREWVEKYSGQYLVPRNLSIVLLNQAGYINIPGPMTGSPQLYDSGDVLIDSSSYTIIGDSYPVIKTSFTDELKVVYEVGQSSEWGKNAILAYIAWAYENRGDEITGSPERAAAIARPHRRVSVWG